MRPKVLLRRAVLLIIAAGIFYEVGYFSSLRFQPDADGQPTVVFMLSRRIPQELPVPKPGAEGPGHVSPTSPPPAPTPSPESAGTTPPSPPAEQPTPPP